MTFSLCFWAELLLEQWFWSFAGSSEPGDIWQRNAGLVPRFGGGQKAGADWTAESQGGAGEGQARPEAPDGSGWAKEGTACHRPGELPGDALFSKSLMPALVIRVPQVLEEISPKGLLSPGNLPQGFSQDSH